MYTFLVRSWSYYNCKAKRSESPSTLVDWIVSSSSLSHEVASAEVKDLFVAASILKSIWEETSWGLGLRGRCAGIGNAMTGKECRNTGTWCVPLSWSSCVNYAGSSPSTSCNHRRFPWYVYSHTHIYVNFTLYSGFLCIWTLVMSAYLSSMIFDIHW